MGFPLLRAKGPLEALLRLAGIVCVMGLAVLGFWKNSERNLERINARTAALSGLDDGTGGLTEADRAHVLAFIEAMRRNYGVVALVRIARQTPKPPEPSESDGKTLFIGLGLEEKTAVVRLPPLVDRALGPDFATNLEREHFPFHFAPGRSWRKGLLAALDLIENRLAAIGAADRKQHDNATSEDTK